MRSFRHYFYDSSMLQNVCANYCLQEVLLKQFFYFHEVTILANDR